MTRIPSNITHEAFLQLIDSFGGTQIFHTFNDNDPSGFSPKFVLETLCDLQEVLKC
jgi:hypothetical protein